MLSIRRLSFVLGLALSLTAPALATEDPPKKDNAGKAQKPEAPVAAKDKCEHGVKKTLCARCNPKLASVYKAKGDWCGEHARPESQCAICHPDLEKQGIKK